jgi:ERCC4-related helicase
LRILNRGKNAEINLPPGTGKTLITQIIACIWLEERRAKGEKVLCVVPSSVLREQHYDYCDWWASGVTLCKPLEVNSKWADNTRVWHQLQAQKTNFWFSLPEVFCNAVEQARIPMDALDRITLVIFDEYDAFSIRVLRAAGERLRFAKDYERLMGLLELRKRRYLLTSATPARHQENHLK